MRSSLLSADRLMVWILASALVSSLPFLQSGPLITCFHSSIVPCRLTSASTVSPWCSYQWELGTQPFPSISCIQWLWFGKDQRPEWIYFSDQQLGRERGIAWWLLPGLEVVLTGMVITLCLSCYNKLLSENSSELAWKQRLFLVPDFWLGHLDRMEITSVLRDREMFRNWT